MTRLPQPPVSPLPPATTAHPSNPAEPAAAGGVVGPDAALEPWVGRVWKIHSNFYYVRLAQGQSVECSLKGLLKKANCDVFVGDWVRLDELLPPACADALPVGRIAERVDRQNVLNKPKIANVDQVLVVVSLNEPPFESRRLDRLLTHVHAAGLNPVIVITKADLPLESHTLEAILQQYEQHLGYSVVVTSVHQPDSLLRLKPLLAGKVSVLAGASGVGKSSLLNALNPAFQLRVEEVSDKIGRGQHTTRHVELLSLFTARPNEAETLVADAPGFSHLDFHGVTPAMVAATFREFAALAPQCEFTDCLHQDETGCAVRVAMQNAQSTASLLSPERYQSYLELLAEARDSEQRLLSSSQKEQYGRKTLHRKGADTLEIVRLKGKNRSDSRRQQRQQMGVVVRQESLLLDEDDRVDDAEYVADGSLADASLADSRDDAEGI